MSMYMYRQTEITPIPGQIRTAPGGKWKVYSKGHEWWEFTHLSSAVYWATLEKRQ